MMGNTLPEKRKRTFRRPFLLLSMLLGIVSLSAQPREITGTVTDAAGPVAGVAVTVQGSTTGTTTDAQGKYTIRAVPAAVLEFSFIGYNAQQVPVGNKNVIDITLTEDSQSIEEVVVIGYGTVKKRDLPGAVSSVKGDQLTTFPTTNPVEALQGKIAGADITKSSGYAGAGVTIRIRGNRSINNPGSSNNPLYIVDGVQGVDVNDINNNDIVSIEVLKDASSTAIYGSRGANGVVLITTRRGTDSKARINYDAYVGISNVAGYGQFMNADQYIAFRKEQYRASGQWDGREESLVSQGVFTAEEYAEVRKGTNNDWPQLSLHQGFQQNHSLSVSGGNDKTQVYFSGNYYDEKGILKNDRYKRFAGRLTIDQKIYSWLKAGMQAQVAYSDNQKRRDPFNVSSKIYPITPAYDDEGNLLVKPFNGEMNPLLDEDLKNYNQRKEGNRTSISAYLELNPIKDLTMRSTFAATLNSDEEGTYYSKTSINGKNKNDQASASNNANRFYSWENTINYAKTLGVHSFGITGITSYNKSISKNLSASGRNLLLPSQLWHNLGAAGSNVSKGSKYSEYSLLSFAGRINYSLKDRYLVTLTGRSDGSSKLGGKWAFFPSAAVGWRIIEENFMKNQQTFSNLKLRVSWGKSGNDAVSPYATQMQLTSLDNFSWDGNEAAATYVLGSTMGNTDLQWETTSTWDIGLDMSFIRDRINLTVDYYNSLTDNLLFSYNLPATTGLSTVSRNFGKTRNKGIEITLETRNFSRKNFVWTTTLTWALNREKIVSLPNGQDMVDADYRKSKLIGHPSNVFYSYVNDGIWQLDEKDEAARWGCEPGDLKIRDIAEPYGVIDAKDRKVIGTTQPDFFGGISNDFRFHNFDINIYMTYRVGQWITSDYWAKYNRNGKNNNAMVNYWTPENPGGVYPRPNASKSLKGEYLSMLSLKDNSYFKIRNITLGYTLPERITSKIHMTKLRFWASVRNPIIISKEPSDFDPESEGVIDKPLNKLYTFGISFGF